MEKGYRVLVFIENYGGADMVSELFRRHAGHRRLNLFPDVRIDFACGGHAQVGFAAGEFAEQLLRQPAII